MEKSRTELLLELIANELLRLRIQMSPSDEEMGVIPEGLSEAFAAKLDDSIIALRKHLGLPVSPFSK